MPQDIESDVERKRKSDICVVVKPGSPGAFLVLPGTFIVPPDGGTIWIRNLTGHSVAVTFPQPIGNGVPVAIPNGRPEQFTLLPAEVNVYDYQVLVDPAGSGIPAHGGSDPRIVYG